MRKTSRTVRSAAGLSTADFVAGAELSLRDDPQVGARPHLLRESAQNRASFIRTPSRLQGILGSETSRSVDPTPPALSDARIVDVDSLDRRFSPNTPNSSGRPISFSHHRMSSTA